jgi:hypothetical protein
MNIRIPIRIHLLKYLRGKANGEQIRIQHYSQLELFEQDSAVIALQRDLARTIYPFLNTTYQWEQAQIRNKLVKYGLISFELKEYLVHSKKLFISFKGVMALNDFIDNLMVEELAMKMDEAIANKKRHDKAILEFMNQYNFDEDDIRFDSLKKRMYRERVKIAEKIYLSNNLKPTSGVLNLSFGDRLIQG